MPAADRPGRNDPCHCGSGRKYKQCCLDKDEAEARAAHARAAEQSAASVHETTKAPHRPPKHQTQQPWKTATTRGFSPRMRTPRKVGGS